MDLLIIDDDNDFRRTAARRLKRRGYRVRDAETPAAGLDFARKQGFEVALVDLMMPVMNGIEFMAKLKEIDASCEVVMLTGEATVETAVSAMKRGAFDYLTKPCPFDELEVILQKAYEHHRLGRENVQLRAALDRARPAVLSYICLRI